MGGHVWYLLFNLTTSWVPKVTFTYGSCCFISQPLGFKKSLMGGTYGSCCLISPPLGFQKSSGGKRGAGEGLLELPCFRCHGKFRYYSYGVNPPPQHPETSLMWRANFNGVSYMYIPILRQTAEFCLNCYVPSVEFPTCAQVAAGIKGWMCNYMSLC